MARRRTKKQRSVAARKGWRCRKAKTSSSRKRHCGHKYKKTKQRLDAAFERGVNVVRRRQPSIRVPQKVLYRRQHRGDWLVVSIWDRSKWLPISYSSAPFRAPGPELPPTLSKRGRKLHDAAEILRQQHLRKLDPLHTFRSFHF